MFDDLNASFDLPSVEVSLDTIIDNSFNYDSDPKYDKLKNSENTPEFFKFLRYIWASLTDSSLYGISENKHATVVPFMRDGKTREMISSRILKFLDDYRDDSALEYKDNENAVIPLKAISQGHLLTCFKVLSSFVMSNSTDNTSKHGSITGLLNLIEIFMSFSPSVIDLSILMDFLIDVVKTLSAEHANKFARFIFGRLEYFKRQFLELESMTDNKRLVQTSGAKFIGLIKTFEASLEESSDVSPIFDLRFLLTYCLPISHLGVCNRQSLSVGAKTINKSSVEEWNHLEQLLHRTKCAGLSDYEINTYESFATSLVNVKATAASHIYDLKSKHEKADKLAVVESFKVPGYEIYSNYCDLLNFILNPEIILEKTQEYIDDLQKMFSSVLSHINSLAEKSKGTEKLSIVMGYTGSPSEFISRCTNISFWNSFLLSSCLAFQTLKLSHKKTNSNDTTYSLLREKCAATIDAIEKNVWNTIYKVKDLSPLINTILVKEKEWISWKQGGCTVDILEPITDDVLSEDIISEEPDRQPKIPPSEVTNFIDILKDLEDKGLNYGYMLDVEPIKLNRHSHLWYLDNVATDEPANTFGERLLQKLCDYRCKLLMDEDPVNDISESDKSKHNEIFRFRFARLFSSNYIENYMSMSNDDIASGSVNSLLNTLGADKDLRRPSKKQK